jgi:hypothetical protein
MVKRQKCPFILDEAEEVAGSQSVVESSEEEEIDVGGKTSPLTQATNGEKSSENVNASVSEEESAGDDDEEEDSSEVSSDESGSDADVIPETPPVSDDEAFPGMNTFKQFIGYKNIGF